MKEIGQDFGADVDIDAWLEEVSFGDAALLQAGEMRAIDAHASDVVRSGHLEMRAVGR
jgi:hypothetical protein